MTIVVPFDGTPLSEAALQRGGELGELFEERVVVVSVIPNSNTRYARERGWLDATETFDPESIVSTLSEQVDTLVPEAIFKYEVVSRYAQAGEIASKIRRVSRDEGADIVVIGSDNAGHIVSNVSSVGSSVAAGRTYDVMIVRNGPGE
jgi:nucleotide-binding universal stress UspA family protein